MMNNYISKSDFFYELPEGLIAQYPANPRDSSSLLVYDGINDIVKHTSFNNILDFLVPGDVLVVNNTKVIPARLFAFDEKARKFEILLLKRIDYFNWECLVKPARKIKVGGKLIVNSELEIEVCEILEDNGVRRIKCNFEGIFEDIIARVGLVPLPPYITRQLDDPSKYQTVYAKFNGSSAAPTAGLHFTEDLIEKIKKKGVIIVEILLHVGLGTFRPVKENNILKHIIHTEHYSVSEDAASKINKAIDCGSRIIAVGTTSVRTLETVADEKGHITAGTGETQIFIYPSYKFKIVDGIITNFHLPESTLIMLVAAYIGREKILEIYKEAIRKEYRFFSFGDAMLLLRGKDV